MELTPDMRKALLEQKKQCPFCKIISGEIPATKVYEDDKVIAIMDINPLTEGHVLLLPKEHYPILPYLSGEEFSHMFKIAKELVFCIQKSLVKTGCNILIANGGVAGQNSPHFMLHIIPREKGDGVSLFELEGDADMADPAPIKHNLTLMMENHFSREPKDWHQAKEMPPQKFSKEQVLEIIEKNPSIKDLMVKDPDALKSQIDSNPQLKALFADVDVDMIISEVTGEKEAEIVEEQPKVQESEQSKEEQTDKPEQPEKSNVEKPDLDDISKLF